MRTRVMLLVSVLTDLDDEQTKSSPEITEGETGMLVV